MQSGSCTSRLNVMWPRSAAATTGRDRGLGRRTCKVLGIWRRPPSLIEPAEALGAARDHVDFDNATSRKRRHANGCSRRQPVLFEVAFVDPVHRGVVALEVGEEDAH